MMKSYNRITLTYSSLDTTKSQTITGIADPTGGNTIKRTVMAVLSIPNWTNGAGITTTFNYKADTGAPVYSIAGLAINQPITAPVVLLFERPLYNGCVVNAVLAGASGGTGGAITVDLFYED